MLSILSNYSLSQTLNQPIHTVNSASPPLSNISRDIRSIRNTDTHCVTVSHLDKSYGSISHGRGRKIQSVKIHVKDNLKSLKKYNVSINTKYYTQVGPSGQKEIEKAINKGNLFFENGSQIGKKHEHALRFNLLKYEDNFRVELAHRNNLNMNTDSIYGFQMKVDYAANSVIFFQVKESGGNMKISGRGRPPVSFSLKNENEIYISINSENGNVLRKKIATLSCPQEWYKFKIRIVWNRHHPNIQVAINGEILFETNVSFGAHNSKNHYSKFGIYIPQQKSKEGVKNTSILFRNVKENHRVFSAKTQPNKVKKS
ncbi:polysaccharide lyase [Pectobacterium versatile]|uniref:polysaccharide lyase n=1 Tax=Pectobacterium versatile TaxID=2488639 RepID=UPI001CCEE63B|nr:polysaccharide lyase [Pectobacterium versatile]